LSTESRYSIVATSWFPSSSSIVWPIHTIRSRYRQFQISTHCHEFSFGVLYGTRGTPMGIIVATERAPRPLRAPRRLAVTLSANVATRRPAIAGSAGAALSPEKEAMPYARTGAREETARAREGGRTPTAAADAANALMMGP
jgi:hypothetical protein